MARPRTWACETHTYLEAIYIIPINPSTLSEAPRTCLNRLTLLDQRGACQGTSCFSPRTDDSRRPFTPCGRITSDALILPCRMGWHRMTEYACSQKLKILEHVAMTIPGPEVIQISMHLHTFWIEGERESEPKRLRMLDCAAIAKWAATSAWFALISHVLGAEKQFNAPTN